MKKDTPKRWFIKYVYWLFSQHLLSTLFNWFSIWFQWRRRRTLYNIFVSHLVVVVVIVVVTSATSKAKKTTLIAAMSASEYLTKNVSVTVAVSVSLSEGVNCDCSRSSFWKFFVPFVKYFIWFRVVVVLAGCFRFLFIELWLPDSNSRGCYDWGVAFRASFKHIETCVFVGWCMRAVCSLCYTALCTMIWFICTQLYDIYMFEVSDCQWVSKWGWYWELSDRWACGYAICVLTVNIEFSMRVTPPSPIKVCVASQHRGSDLGI